MGNQNNCSVVFTLFKVTFLGKWDECGERPFLWPLTSFPDCHTYSVHSVQCCLSSCFPVLNSSAETSSGPVALPLAVWQIARATSEWSGGGSFSQYSCSVPFPSSSWYKSSQYPFHLSAICAASVKFPPIVDWIHCRRGWNFQVIDLTIWKICLEFPFVSASNSAHMPSSCCCLSNELFLNLCLQFLISVLIFAFCFSLFPD